MKQKRPIHHFDGQVWQKFQFVMEVPSFSMMSLWLIGAIWCHRTWHDDVIKWNHFPRYWPFVWGIHRPPVNSPHKGQRRGALMFSLICARMNVWVNNREAGDLRRHRANYDFTVMVHIGSGNGLLPHGIVVATVGMNVIILSRQSDLLAINSLLRKYSGSYVLHVLTNPTDMILSWHENPFHIAGSCFTTAIRRCRKPISHCRCSFNLKVVLPLVKRSTTAPHRSSKTDPWPFWRGNYRIALHFPLKVMWNFGVFSYISLDELLNKQSSYYWFLSSWHWQCNEQLQLRLFGTCNTVYRNYIHCNVINHVTSRAGCFKLFSFFPKTSKFIPLYITDTTIATEIVLLNPTLSWKVWFF